MAKKTDKRTSNLIIAGGYCLVAIIILLNYLGESSRARKMADRASVSTQIESEYDQNFEKLQKQLEEEKKVNLEMRSLLRQLQRNGSGVMKSAAAHTFVGGKIDFDEPLPRLNVEALKRALQPKQNPFIPGKNPYAPDSKREDANKVVSTVFPFKNSLKCDPNLPFLISGANTDSVFLGN
ncbi:MAG: hypothetical protein PWR01_3755 [Clostridiales bacterium]|jgi:hypothetical protein|nr:hypothetical protein [Clostridiales bacterium]MDN5282682.1 hypothetical protein [Candidatus Ozemobacter sp.]